MYVHTNAGYNVHGTFVALGVSLFTTKKVDGPELARFVFCTPWSIHGSSWV